MNIVEHAWDKLDKCLHSRNPLLCNLDELWDALVEEWGNLDLSYVRKLYNSMPHRVAALVDAKGYYTKY